MRGRKHPLEVFRSTGRSFLTQREELARQEEPKRPEPAAESEAPARRPRRSLRPLDPEVLAAAQKETAARDAAPAAAPAAPPPSARRTWDVRAEPYAAKAATARKAKPKSSPSQSLARVATILAGLVLLVGGTYALGLWPFVPVREKADGPTNLRSSRPAQWPDRTAEASDDGTSEQPDDGGDPSTDGAKSEAPGEPGVEYWVVAASLKLSADMRKNDELWKQAFRPDRERAERALGSDFPAVRIQACKSAGHEDAMLRIGPGASADDPALVALLDRIKRGGFKDANIKAFRKR